MNNRLCAIALAMLLMIPSAVSAELYYWIGPDGTKHFSNSPPPSEVEEYGSAGEIEYGQPASAGGTAEGDTGNPNETAFKLQKRKIIVPVSLGYKGRTKSGYLVLDTGATATTIFKPEAKRLNIDESRPVRVHVAGGAVLQAIGVNVDWFQVGPHREKNFTVVIIEDTGEYKDFKGVIGMNFLEKHPYTLDMKRKVIVWHTNQ